MIRNLKIAVAAAMALAALGAISASGAQAAEGHCSVEPCTITVKPDGTPGVAGKTAHHVFIFTQIPDSVALTCEEFTGDATVATKTFKTFQLGKIVYDKCGGFALRMNGCEYHLETPGNLPHDAKVKVVCPAGKVIEFELTASKCLFTIGNTGALGQGVKFHDAETGGVKKDIITMETTLTNIPVTVANDLCEPLGFSKGVATTGQYTTGNIELTGETAVGVHANLWWE